MDSPTRALLILLAWSAAANGALGRPVSLAAGDVDGDGNQDVVCGLATGDIGNLIVHWRLTELTSTVSMPGPPSFLHAVDLDGDGPAELLAATRRGRSIHLFRSDDKRNLEPAGVLSLPGELTAVAVGELGARDGSAEIIAAVGSPDGPRVLVFGRSDLGPPVLRESFALAEAASALLLGRFDAGPTSDLLIATPTALLLFRGETSVSIATIELAARVVALGHAQFDASNLGERPVAVLDDGTVWGLVRLDETGEGWERRRLGVLPGKIPPLTGLAAARWSGTPSDDLVVLLPDGAGLYRLTEGGDSERAAQSIDLPGTPVAFLPLRLNGDALSDLVVLLEGSSEPVVLETAAASIFVVTSIANAGPGSLRQAILDANAAAGIDAIHFDIAGAGPHTITPTSALPVITEPVTIDATSEPSFTGSPVVEISGALIPSANGLEISAGSSVVRGLVINRFAAGILLRGAGGNVIEGNYVGTDPTGTADLGNAFYGVRVETGNANTIGGTTPQARNVVSGNNNNGISFAAGTTSNRAQGNYVGTDPTGTSALPNGSGITVDGQSGFPTSNTIGGTEPGAGNLVSGNHGGGVGLGGTTAGHLVQGNSIGTDASGSVALGNGGSGIAIAFGSCCNTVGGITAAARNVISGNGTNGIRSDYNTNTIQGNFIGVQRDGSSPLGNGAHGILVNFTANHTIGGSQDGASNTVAFNGSDGVFFSGGGSGIVILSNAIFRNGDLGIDLGPDGITPNDSADTDEGVNGLQNYPEITSAANGGASTRIDGMLDSTPSTTFLLEFFSTPLCDSGGNGEGAQTLGTMNTTTNAAGIAAFSSTIDAALPAGHVVTSTATHPTRGTSEFSACRAVVCTASTPTGTPNLQVEKNGLGWSSLPSASAYDVVRGDLSSLRTSFGDFATSTADCVANDLETTALPYLDLPLPGEGHSFVVRGINCAGPGTFDSNGPSQTGSRDGEIADSAHACP